MNTDRAKIALIVAFLGLNLFLAYNLFSPDFRGQPSSDLPVEELQRIELFIQDSGYRLDVPLDRTVQTGTFITVAPYSFERSLVAEEAYSVAYGEQADIYHCPGKQVKFYPGGRTEICYTPGVPLDLFDSTEEELKILVQTFLQDSIPFLQLKFDLIQEGGSGERIITYTQTFEGADIYSSFVKATVIGGSLTMVEYLWLMPLKRPQEHPINMISAAEAVLKLVEELGPVDQPRYVVRLDLGFYSQEYEAEQWDVPPVWRIILDHRQTYYVNAFTGNLENDLNINENERSNKF